MSFTQGPAPGGPGIPPRWTSSAKTGVGTARNTISRIWFTISHGVLNEIYYPRVDLACMRDMGMIVTDGDQFFSQEQRHTVSEVNYLADGVPGFRVVNTCTQGRFRIEKEIFAHPRRDVVLQWTRFVPLLGEASDFHLYVLLAPHLANHGSNNTGWVADYKGVPMLFASRDTMALALGSTVPWAARAVGFAGVNDGWQDLVRNRRLTWFHDRAENGNVALVGEIDLATAQDGFVLGVGFARSDVSAGHQVRAALSDDFAQVREDYIDAWRDWQKSLFPLAKAEPRSKDLFHISAAVLRTHEAKNFPGGIIASLSIPWGFHKGDDDLGGYHLVWPRDLVESAGGLLACGARDDALRVLHYLQITQEADGHWPQNMWIDGNPYWDGLQMDETAFPILLVDLAHREGFLDRSVQQKLWPMVRKAASFLARNGPVTQEDRWEEDPGFSPFTLAAEIAGLLAAADLADDHDDPRAATYLRELADTWNDNIERWIYVEGTDLTRKLGVDGYYVRVAAAETADAASPKGGFVPIKNRPAEKSTLLAELMVSPDALALVRFGLRSPSDPRIVNTVKVIDHLLRVETPHGPSWYRYNEDGYGEHSDGRPFDGTGVGRPWPLLTGERGHYELALGNRAEAERLLTTMENFANNSGLIPEQVWDSEDMPERELVRGGPTGSAMPLVWAHSEYIKLRRSIHVGKVFDMPPQTVQRYQVEKVGSRLRIWRFNHKTVTMPAGKTLRIEVLAPALIHWTTDGWKNLQDLPTWHPGLGMHIADLPTENLERGAELLFTFFWTDAQKWEGTDFLINVV